MKLNAAQTIAQALIDLGVEILTHVPGFGGSEVFQAYNEMARKRLPLSFHEESAFTIAHSASICGKRSATMIKAHGFMKAANSISDALYSEISAGFVTIIFEDSSGKHSDSIFEIIPILQGMSIPFFQSKMDMLYDDVINSFLESETRKMPVVLLVDSLKLNEEISTYLNTINDFLAGRIVDNKELIHSLVNFDLYIGSSEVINKEEFKIFEKIIDKLIEFLSK